MLNANGSTITTSTLPDISGNANDGTITGATPSAQGLTFVSATDSQNVVIPTTCGTNTTSTIIFAIKVPSEDPTYTGQPSGAIINNVVAFNNPSGIYFGPTQGKLYFGSYGLDDTTNAPYTFLGVHIVAYTFGNPNLIYIDGVATPGYVKQGTGAFPTATQAVHIGDYGGGGTSGNCCGLNGTLYWFASHNVVLTADEVAQKTAYIQQQINGRGITIGSPTLPQNTLSLLGDSLTAGSAIANYQSSISWQAVRRSGLPFNIQNAALPGTTCSTYLGLTSSWLDASFIFFPTGFKMLDLWCGTNDMTSGASAATTYGKIQSLLAARPVTEAVIVNTLIQRNGTGFPSVSNTFNASMRTGYQNGTIGPQPVYLCDLGLDPLIGVPLGVPFLIDQATHPNALGNGIISNYKRVCYSQAYQPQVPVIQQITIPHGTLTTAGTTQALPIYTLGPKQKVCGVTVKSQTPYKGGIVNAFTVSIGDSTGSATTYSSAFDIFQAPGNTVFQDTVNFKSASYAGGTVTANFTSVLANVNAPFTDLVIGGTNTNVSSASYTFVSPSSGALLANCVAGNSLISCGDVGTTITITAGTNFTTGQYLITAVSGGVATLDRSAGTASSTGGSYLVGSVNVSLCLVTAP